MLGYIAKDERDNSYYDSGLGGTGIGIKKQYILNGENINYIDILKTKKDMNDNAILYIIHYGGSNWREFFYSNKDIKQVSPDIMNELNPLEIECTPHIKGIKIFDIADKKDDQNFQSKIYSKTMEIRLYVFLLLIFIYIVFMSKSSMFIDYGLTVVACVFVIFGKTHASDELLYLIGDSKNQRYVKIKYICMILSLPISIILLAYLDWNHYPTSKILDQVSLLIFLSVIILFFIFKKIRRLHT